MIKKYITKLPEGRETQYATLLGRQVLLTDSKIVNESLLTRIYSSYFKEIKDTETPVKQEPVIEEVKEEKVTLPMMVTTVPQLKTLKMYSMFIM